ncbi:MAG: polysaccharide deacetylase family protein [Solobacterium sp.]|nr:polysaccharide deacetylase family protein [Solobacterium sp.]MBQ1446737.1 polysaccharide deacetylase family protein [Solobacterium sp.]MBQ6593437.1 polysaccharide deacetylase family protein [Solobacterium sp.]
MSGEKRICLTFDDGPSEYTENLLDGLAERNAKASFFLIGNRVEKYRKTVLRMKEEGHTIGQHTQNHADLTKISEQEVREEINSANEAIMRITGERPRYVRPPFGEYNDRIVLDTDMVFVTWSYSSLDWEFKYPEVVCRRTVNKAFDGAVVLAHDIFSSSVTGMLKAVDILMDQGYIFISLDDMVKYRQYEPLIHRVYSRF